MFRWAFQFLLVLALSLWVGSLLFFTIIVTPGIFTALDRPAAGKLLAELFPRYYRTGAICGFAAVLVLMLLFLFDSGSRSLRFLQLTLVLLMLSATLYAGWILQPRIHQMRQERLRASQAEQREEAEIGFQKLHARSVRVNAGVIALGMAGLGTLAIRKRP
jgi:uncharacterized membrane protein